jgi:dTDP-4-amino-4,6-dideoxygalactose transaminase
VPDNTLHPSEAGRRTAIRAGTVAALERLIRDHTGRRFVRLVGRGTTAEFIALRAIAATTPIRMVVLPDQICQVALDGALLAGFTPLFADVVGGRFTLDFGSAQHMVSAAGTEAVLLYTHLFGFQAGLPPPAAALLPYTIEDAVQGIGGIGAGRQGDLSVISFDETKMIGGRGGAVLTDDEAMWEAIQSVDDTLPANDATDPLVAVPSMPPEMFGRLRVYRNALADSHHLLVPFDASAANIERISAGWAQLALRSRVGNANAARLYEALHDLPLELAPPHPGDAIWRYPLAAPTVALANWILRHLQGAGLRGSSLYTPLSALFEGPAPVECAQSGARSAALTRRMVNLWVDAETTQAALDQAVRIIRSAPFDRLGQ